MKSFKQYISEMAVVVGKGKKYGQIMFLAGGAGSGKGFAVKNFLEFEKFKIMDVDEWKQQIIKISKLKDKHKELQNLNLRNPKDVFKIHDYVEKSNIKDKKLMSTLKSIKHKEVLPNIIFDVTLKSTSYIETVIPRLIEAGYDPKNIHITWVLTDYKIAVSQNKNRSRVVPDDVLLKTHEGAATTMYNILRGNIPKGIDGAINVILGGAKNTIFWTDKEGKKILSQRTVKDKKTGKEIIVKSPVIKRFKYLNIKKEGQTLKLNDAFLQLKLYSWMVDHIPITKKTKDIWHS